VAAHRAAPVTRQICRSALDYGLAAHPCLRHLSGKVVTILGALPQQNGHSASEVLRQPLALTAI